VSLLRVAEAEERLVLVVRSTTRVAAQSALSGQRHSPLGVLEPHSAAPFSFHPLSASYRIVTSAGVLLCCLSLALLHSLYQTVSFNLVLRLSCATRCFTVTIA
jgi:hypothetical protein